MCFAFIARWLRDRDRDRDGNAATNFTTVDSPSAIYLTGDEYRASWKSIKQVAELQDRRFAIIQRISRLNDTAAVTSKTKTKTESQEAQAQAPEQPPPYRKHAPSGKPDSRNELEHNNSSLEEDPHKEQARKEEVHELRRELESALRDICTTSPQTPRDAVYDLYKELHSKRRDDEGRTGFWYHASAVCTAKGGCCARAGGCCKAPVEKFYKSRQAGGSLERKRFKHYWHRTAECACCIKAYGFYAPDPRLPKPRVLPQFQPLSYQAT